MLESALGRGLTLNIILKLCTLVQVGYLLSRYCNIHKIILYLICHFCLLCRVFKIHSPRFYPPGPWLRESNTEYKKVFFLVFVYRDNHFLSPCWMLVALAEYISKGGEKPFSVYQAWFGFLLQKKAELLLIISIRNRWGGERIFVV